MCCCLMSQKSSLSVRPCSLCVCLRLSASCPAMNQTSPTRMPTMHSPSNTAQSIDAASDVLAGAWEGRVGEKRAETLSCGKRRSKVGRFMTDRPTGPPSPLWGGPYRGDRPSVRRTRTRPECRQATADRELTSSRPGPQVRRSFSWCTTGAKGILWQSDDFCPHS